VITDDEAKELAGEDAFAEIRRAREAVEEDVEWALETATAGQEDWTATMPTDAGKSLFGGRDDADDGVNERVEAEWVDETTPFERVRSVMAHTYKPQSVGDIADRARTSEETARKHLRSLADNGFVEETDNPGRSDALYRRSPKSLILEQARDILDGVDSNTLVVRISEMESDIRSYREKYDVDVPEHAYIDEKTLTD